MQTWLELEQRFRSLAPSLRHSRLDAQWGVAGEHWRIAGSTDPLVVQQFEALASVAGQMLKRAMKTKESVEPKAPEASDPRLRWYNLLKEASPSFRDLRYGEQRNADGTSAGFIYMGSLPQFADASANLCLSLHTSHPIENKPSRWRWFHENYGKSLIIGIILALVGTVAKLWIA